MRLNKGVYYNIIRDDLLLITKSEDKNYWNKETEELIEDSKVNFVYMDNGVVHRVSGVLLAGKDNLVYLGEY